MSGELLLPVEVRDALVAYLLTRPMNEVEQGVWALRNLEAVGNPENGDVAAAFEPRAPIGGRRKGADAIQRDAAE